MSQNIENGLNNVNDITAGSKIACYKKSYNKYADGVAVAEELISYKYEKGDARSAAVASVIDNFEEYIKNKNERAREEGIDEAEKERQDRENAKELARNLSSEELKQLELMGIDVSSASLSDIRGIVNTMRGNTHREKMTQLLSDIISPDMMSSEVDSVDNHVSIGTSDDAFIYLVKNQLPMTKDNMYKAYYSGYGKTEEAVHISEDAMREILPQVERVIEQAGYGDDSKAFEGAKLLLDSGLPVTTDTISAYMDYQAYSDGVKNEINIYAPETEAEIYDKKVYEFFDKLNHITDAAVYEMSLLGKPVTIASLYKYSSDKPSEYTNYEFKANSQKELEAVTNMRRLEEIRLSMTVDAARRLIKRDINIDTRELSRVVDELKNMEQELVTVQLKNEGVDATPDNIKLYNELNNKVYGLADAPAGVIAAPLLGREFTVNALYENIPEDIQNSGKFERVVKNYEAVGTAPRSDMGDSIQKAFSNVDDILKELDMPVSDENRRAVRILGYNSIEITPDNISRVSEYDSQVNELIQNFYPEAVISVIKEGINPLDMEISELNRLVRERNYNDGVSEAQNFAAYLRDIEKRGNISPEERESYIGIYRVMNKLAKSGDREAGYLFANGGNLTVRNLILAMRSRKAAGLDVKVDDDFGMLTDVDMAGKRIDEQIDSAYVARTIDKFTDETDKFIKENNIKYSMVNAEAVSEILSDGGLYGIVSELLSKLKFKNNDSDRLADDEEENMSESMLGKEIPIEFEADSILEKFREGKDMSLTYDDLRNNLTELMYQSGITGTMTSMDIASVKVIQAGFNILDNMARQDKYQVPVRTEEGIHIVNITIKHDEKLKGTIELNTKGNLMGEVRASFRLNEKKGLKGYIIADSDEGNNMLVDSKEELLKQLDKYGFKACEIAFRNMSVWSEPTGENPSAENIYNSAVGIVKAVASILR